MFFMISTYNNDMKTFDDNPKKKGSAELTLHELIDDAIVDQKLKRTEVAKEIGVDRSTVSNWCNGKRTPEISKLKPLCTLLDLDIYQILGIEAPKHSLSPFEQELIDTYRLMSRKEQNAMLEVFRAFTSKDKSK